MIIGEATLTAQCVDLARAGGLDVVVVATTDEQVRAHAERLGIATVSSAGDLTEALLPYDADALLSIVNFRIVPPAVLERVRIAINFHDGPLPARVGRNVTSWAILEGAHSHAVTWHAMTDDVDGGDIVHTAEIPIEVDDTAFSLNARCYEAALTTFPLVLQGLVSGDVELNGQPPGERRTFGATDRPMCIIDTGHDAVTAERMIRALSFGPHVPNPLGVGLLVHGTHLAVASGAVADGAASAPPGTLVAEPEEVRLSMATGTLRVTTMELPDGTPIATSDAREHLGLADGQLLGPPPTSLVDALRRHHPLLARHERYWTGRLTEARVTGPDLPVDASDGGRHTANVAVPTGCTGDDLVAIVAAWCHRLTGATSNVVAVLDEPAGALVCELAPLAAAPFVFVSPDGDTTFSALRSDVAAQRAEMARQATYLHDLVGRQPSLRGGAPRPQITVDLSGRPEPMRVPSERLRLRWTDGSPNAELSGMVDAATLARFADHVSTLLAAASAAPNLPIGDLPMLGTAEQALLDATASHPLAFDDSTTIDRLVADQVLRSPEAPALTAAGTSLTYRELDRLSAQLAITLGRAGVGEGSRVGIALERGTDLVVGVLATLRCGAAYVPLDPTYPIERLRFMLADSGAETLLATRGNAVAESLAGAITLVDPAESRHEHTAEAPEPHHGPDHLAYVIYTSGSTGTPKGVMVEHQNVVNFFAAMDEVIETDRAGAWLALTSLSFDISVLELLWTLTRGYHVVLHGAHRTRPRAQPTEQTGSASLSLFYFAAGDDGAGESYRLVLESARWADAHGLEAVWSPERHFHAFGGAYPNPSVLAAAVAAVTTRIGVRAGSVVAPLHHPIRIAEEWAVVDNLSNGRTAISFAAGWQPNDFVLNPGAFADAREQLPSTIDAVCRLWRGEAVEMPAPDGQLVPVTTLPRPVQAELPVWLTSAGSPATFERAGSMGHNVLTHLLGQSIEQLSENVRVYRQARRAAGHAGDGRVTLMLHTYLHPDAQIARERARGPLMRYLASATGLIRNMASAFPTFANSHAGADDAFASLTPAELDQLLDVAASRYLDTAGLFGTVDDATEFAARCVAAGADEIACLIDFGIGTDLVLESLPLLGEVHDRVQHLGDRPAEGQPEPDASVAELCLQHGVTHLQCTPSQMRMLLADPADRRALAGLDHVLLGGEALPTALAAELRASLTGRITNMYGPTETTIWSLCHEITTPPDDTVPIGRPIGNNTVLVLDERGQRLPIGITGEIHIAGRGVARGYHDRPELTAERFRTRPGEARTYATGDLGRVRADGVVDYAGRVDHQVKIRGHRIEPGEIEAVLDGHPLVNQSIVFARTSPTGDEELIAVFVAAGDHRLTEADVRDYAGARLPEAYVPAHAVQIAALPQTPNGKVDRGRLISNADELLAERWAAAPLDDFASPTEQLVAEEWSRAIDRPIRRDDNFFEVGGNSLAAVAVFRQLCQRTATPLALTDIFRYPTVRALAAHIASAQRPNSAESSTARTPDADRGALRRRALSRRSQ